jgi:hypothetical protein
MKWLINKIKDYLRLKAIENFRKNAVEVGSTYMFVYKPIKKESQESIFCTIRGYAVRNCTDVPYYIIIKTVKPIILQNSFCVRLDDLGGTFMRITDHEFVVERNLIDYEKEKRELIAIPITYLYDSEHFYKTSKKELKLKLPNDKR